VCVSAKQRHSSEGATTTYEMPNVDTQRPESYQQLPSQTGQQHDYYNVDNPPDMSTTIPYEELNVGVQIAIEDSAKHPHSYLELISD